jgi:hypothetical protein
VAVALASVASLALLEVVSNASKTSETIISRFDESMMMGIMAGIADEQMHNRTVRLGDELRERYSIDRSDIVESLESYEYDVRHTGKEYVDPLMMSGINPPSSLNSLSVETMIVQRGNTKKTVYGITTGVQE